MQQGKPERLFRLFTDARDKLVQEAKDSGEFETGPQALKAKRLEMMRVMRLRLMTETHSVMLMGLVTGMNLLTLTGNY